KHCEERRAARGPAFGVTFHAGDGECARWLYDGADVLEDVLDRGTNLVGADQDDLVDDLARDAKRLVANATHGDAVGERADAIERDDAARAQRLVHARGFIRLDAHDLDAGVAVLEIGADAADQPAAADGHEDCVGHARPLPLELRADRALTGD